MSYWYDRMADAQNRLTNKSIRQTEKQLKKYYQAAMEKTIADFEATYQKILDSVANGREPTPADLYKLDKYWQSQAQLKTQLQKLGDKQISLLSKEFEENWRKIYNSIAIPGSDTFNTVDDSQVQQMINSIWVADGKSWSERIWENTERLAAELNDGLIHCVATGKKSAELKKILQERFGVSYSSADSLVRTEMAHIQTEAARKRYEDAGVQEVEVYAPKDERQCDVCGKLHGKKFSAFGTMPVPAHPRCRCCIIPVVDTGEESAKRWIEEPIQRAVEKPVTAPNLRPAPQNINLTLQNNNANIQLDVPQQRAQEKVKELQQQGDLHIYDKKKESHIKHIKDILRIEEVDEAAWAEYEKMASDFLKKDIDGDKMDGFISRAGWLFKFEKETGLFGLLSDKGTISTFFVPDKMTPEDYWKAQIEKYKPKE